MSTAIATKTVTGRRELHFSSIDEILADVDQLAKAKELRNLGNWSFGQILNHLAMVMKTSLDGSPTGLRESFVSSSRCFSKKGSSTNRCRRVSTDRRNSCRRQPAPRRA